METKKIIKHIILWMKSYIKKTNSNGFVIGISGGIDSSVTSTITAMTKFPTIVLEMPFFEQDNKTSTKHIQFLVNKFYNVSFLKKNIKKVFENFHYLITSDNYNKKINKEILNLAFANLKSRIRMIILYYYANIENYLVVGTGNKIEDFGVGFFTKYGDGGVDIQPIADLKKSEIYLIAKKLNILPEIQKSIPNDGLWDDFRSDEYQLGANYDELEWAMENEENINYDLLSKRQKKVMDIYKQLKTQNMHKVKNIPICKIPKFLK